jgi:hypothetical protein
VPPTPSPAPPPLSAGRIAARWLWSHACSLLFFHSGRHEVAWAAERFGWAHLPRWMPRQQNCGAARQKTS